MDQQRVKKRSQDQVISSEDGFDASEPPRKRLKMQLCANNMNSQSVNNGDDIENIGSNNCTSNINGGNFYANNRYRMIDIEEDEELMQGIQRLKRLKVLFEYNLITQEDHDSRKSQIVDELTGTSASTSTYMSRKPDTPERLPFHGSPGSPNQSANSPNPTEKKKQKSGSCVSFCFFFSFVVLF